MKRVTLTCATCGVEFEHGGGPGRRPKHCEEHRARRSRAVTLKRKARQGDEEAKAKAVELGLSVADQSASDGERFALYLGALGDNVELAARAAQVPALPPVELERYASAVRKRHKDHYQGRPEVAALHLQQAQILLALRIRDSVSDIPPNLLGSTLRQVTEAIQTTTGGGSMIYGDFVVRLNPPSADDLRAWLEATGADPEMLAESW